MEKKVEEATWSMNNEALKATASMIEGKLPKKLKKFLSKNIVSKEVQENLAILDKKLAKQITE